MATTSNKNPDHGKALSTMNQLNNQLPSAERQKTMFCFGGKFPRGVRSYNPFISFWDPNSFSWKEMDAIDCDGGEVVPQERSQFGAVAVGSKVYLYGGKKSNGTTLKKFEVFDCVTRRLTDVISPNSDDIDYREDCAVEVLGDYLYVSGGRKPSGHHLSSVIRFKLSGDGCERDTKFVGTQMLHNVPRMNHQLVAFENRLYAIGGHFTNTVESWAPGENKWRYEAMAKNPHKHAGAAILHGKLHILSYNGHEVFEKDNSDTAVNGKSWRALTLPQPVPGGWGRRLLAFEDKLLCFGGDIKRRYEEITAQICYVGEDNDLIKNVRHFIENDSLGVRKFGQLDVGRKYHCMVVAETSPDHFLQKVIKKEVKQEVKEVKPEAQKSAVKTEPK